MNQNPDKFWRTVIGLVSVAVIGLVIILMSLPKGNVTGTRSQLLTILPTVNAVLNFLTLVALTVAYFFIKKRNITWHRRSMLTAFALSAAFLLSYVTYHALQSGPTRYTGSYRGFYFTILISHILLAAVILPLALWTLYHGWTDQRAKHKRIAKKTLPLWIYVSLTGVLIYLMLYVI